MSQRAPDFWSWRKAVLFFESEKSEEPIVPMVLDLNPPKISFDPQGNDNFIPPPAEILSEIQQLESKNPTSPNLATLYAKLANIYAKRIASSAATNLEEEQQQASNAFEEAIDRYQELNKQSALASTLNNFGDFLFKQSRYQDAINIYQQSLYVRREIGDRYSEANSLNNLGNIYCLLGDYQQAIEFYQQSLAIQRKIGDLVGEANSLNNLGVVFNLLGNNQQAIEFHQQSLAIRHQIGDLHGEANSLGDLGWPL
jgi:tetratricopeptide (TPR) repeat protein